MQPLFQKKKSTVILISVNFNEFLVSVVKVHALTYRHVCKKLFTKAIRDKLYTWGISCGDTGEE